MATNISNSDDTIDSRDVIERIEELEAEREALAETLEETRSAHEEAEAAQAAVDEGDEEADHDLASKLDDLTTKLEQAQHENGDELKSLKALQDEAEGYCDWTDGAQLIRDSYFTEAMSGTFRRTSRATWSSTGTRRRPICGLITRAWTLEVLPIGFGEQEAQHKAPTTGASHENRRSASPVERNGQHSRRLCLGTQRLRIPWRPQVDGERHRPDVQAQAGNRQGAA